MDGNGVDQPTIMLIKILDDAVYDKENRAVLEAVRKLRKHRPVLLLRSPSAFSGFWQNAEEESPQY